MATHVALVAQRRNNDANAAPRPSLARVVAGTHRRSASAPHTRIFAVFQGGRDERAVSAMKAACVDEVTGNRHFATDLALCVREASFSLRRKAGYPEEEDDTNAGVTMCLLVIRNDMIVCATAGGNARAVMGRTRTEAGSVCQAVPLSRNVVTTASPRPGLWEPNVEVTWATGGDDFVLVGDNVFWSSMQDSTLAVKLVQSALKRRRNDLSYASNKLSFVAGNTRGRRQDFGLILAKLDKSCSSSRHLEVASLSGSSSSLTTVVADLFGGRKGRINDADL